MKLYKHIFVLLKTESIFIGFCFSWQNHEHKIQTLEKISQYHQGKWTWVLFLFFQKLLFWSCFSTYRGSSRYMDSVYADSLYASSKFPRKLRNTVQNYTIVIFYTEILTGKVVLWCFFSSETSEKIHNSTFQVKISV